MHVETEYPVHELISARWSPYCFSDRTVSEEDLRSLFEAARWAPSSYNEQPWHFIVATKQDADEFQRLLSCLVETNQVWARAASVLVIAVIRLTFAHNSKPNRAAMHDLGLATANLMLEATSRGLYVHAMIGILPERAREVYAIPDGFQPLTALAIGYAGSSNFIPDDIRERDHSRRLRKPLAEFVFSNQWGKTAPLAHQRGQR